jgi:SHS2 domain-containing protein
MDMKESILRGFQEVEHTADWALKAWAPDLAGLFLEAAQGMTGLMEMELDEAQMVIQNIQLRAEDAEGLLVAFLSEILFIAESEGLGFSSARLTIHISQLDAKLELMRIKTQRKEIKAVTYHNLEIRETEFGLETVIVFDV